MSKVTCQVSSSRDGFVAGPNQKPENPIGEGGMSCTTVGSSPKAGAPSTGSRAMSARLTPR